MRIKLLGHKLSYFKRNIPNYNFSSFSNFSGIRAFHLKVHFTITCYTSCQWISLKRLLHFRNQKMASSAENWTGKAQNWILHQKSPSPIPFIEKQTMTMGSTGVYRPLCKGGIPVVMSGTRSAQRSSFLNNGQIWVWEAGRPASRGDAFEKLISTKPYARFTRGLHRVVGLSIKAAYIWIWLIWGSPSQVARAAWRVSKWPLGYNSGIGSADCNQLWYEL